MDDGLLDNAQQRGNDVLQWQKTSDYRTINKRFLFYLSQQYLFVFKRVAFLIVIFLRLTVENWQISPIFRNSICSDQLILPPLNWSTVYAHKRQINSVREDQFILISFMHGGRSREIR